MRKGLLIDKNEEMIEEKRRKEMIRKKREDKIKKKSIDERGNGKIGKDRGEM